MKRPPGPPPSRGGTPRRPESEPERARDARIVPFRRPTKTDARPDAVSESETPTEDIPVVASSAEATAEPDVAQPGRAAQASADARAERRRRRAERSEARRFTAPARLRRRRWAGGLGAVSAVALISVAAAYTPLVAVRSIVVEGAERIDAATVTAELRDQLGRPFPFVSHDEIKQVLVRYPLIETYRVDARPPSTLAIRLIERTPIGAIASSSGFAVVDAAGVVIESSEAQPEGQPLIDVTGGIEGDAFRAIGPVVRGLSAPLRSELVRVSATEADDVEFELDGGQRVVWGDSGDSELKERVLSSLRAALPDAAGFDVSSPAVPLAL